MTTMPEGRKLVIAPGMADKHYLRDVWQYRELFFVLAWRDVSVRYKQTAVGLAWAVLRPVLTMLIFSFVFGRVARLSSPEGIPYPLVVFAGLLPWHFFASAFYDASNSLVENSNLISKIYFPRIVIPVASVMVSVVDFIVGTAVLVAMLVWFGVVPSWRLALFPVLFVFTFLSCLGPALWVASVNVKYRDFRYVIPFVVQLGLYVSPVGYSSEVVPSGWRFAYSLNPMVGVIDGFRWAVVGECIYWPGMLLSTAVIGLMLIVGVRKFRRMEKRFADLI